MLHIWTNRARHGLTMLLMALAGGAQAGSVEQRTQIRWQAPQAEFGGLSGLAVLDAGARLLVISDRGTIFSADMIRQDGDLTGLNVTARAPLRDTKGAAPRPFLRNAEALAAEATGPGFYVAYEGYPRVWRYASPDALPEWTHVWDRFWFLLGNEGLEALAIDATGRLYAISEKAVSADGGFPVYRYDGTEWEEIFTIPRRDDFAVSGADFGPDGRLYVLERRFLWYEGFRTRIRRLGLGPDGILQQDLLLDSPPGDLDNSEGISVWQDPAGVTRITLVADDNFNLLQRSLITEFIVTD